MNIQKKSLPDFLSHWLLSSRSILKLRYSLPEFFCIYELYLCNAPKVWISSSSIFQSFLSAFEAFAQSIPAWLWDSLADMIAPHKLPTFFPVDDAIENFHLFLEELVDYCVQLTAHQIEVRVFGWESELLNNFFSFLKELSLILLIQSAFLLPWAAHIFELWVLIYHPSSQSS